MALISRRVYIKRAFGGALTMACHTGAATCLDFLATDEGPFFPSDVQIPNTSDLTRRVPAGPRAVGEIIHIAGTVFGPDCKPLSGASVAIWQADNNGMYKHFSNENENHLDPNFMYFGRIITEVEGAYNFTTILPKPYEYEGLLRARHVHFELIHPEFGRMTTEMYFADDQDYARRRNDEVWKSRNVHLRSSLISKRLPQSAPYFDDVALAGDDVSAFRFDLRFSNAHT